MDKYNRYINTTDGQICSSAFPSPEKQYMASYSISRRGSRAHFLVDCISTNVLQMARMQSPTVAELFQLPAGQLGRRTCTAWVWCMGYWHPLGLLGTAGAAPMIKSAAPLKISLPLHHRTWAVPSWRSLVFAGTSRVWCNRYWDYMRLCEPSGAPSSKEHQQFPGFSLRQEMSCWWWGLEESVRVYSGI